MFMYLRHIYRSKVKRVISLFVSFAYMFFFSLITFFSLFYTTDKTSFLGYYTKRKPLFNTGVRVLLVTVLLG